MVLLRKDGRDSESLRDCTIIRGVNKYAEGSCRIQMGDTHVICTATVQEQVPRWRQEGEEGWVTGEYSMLPRATSERTDRESHRGHRQGRSMEIERLIGRSLRAVTDLKALGTRTVVVDCDNQEATTLWTDPPSPQPGDRDHYDTFVQRIARAYARLEW